MYGAFEELGLKEVKDKTHIHDLYANLLHLRGLDHEQRIYRYAGRDIRITDVHGLVVKGIMATKLVWIRMKALNKKINFDKIEP